MTVDQPEAESHDGSHVNPIPVEAREYQGHRAGVVSRTIAGTIDFVVTVAVLGGTYVAWAAFRFLLDPTRFSFPTVKPLWFIVASGAFLFVYLTVSWATSGQTYGAHVMGLRVVNFRGKRLRPGGAILRSAFCVGLPIGLFWCAVSHQNRSVQDVALRTSVIYDWQPRRGGSRAA